MVGYGDGTYGVETYGGGGDGLSWFGPVTETASWVSPDPVEWARNPAGQLLMRHYGPRPEGVNVFIMTNGTVTTDDPIDWSLVRKALWGAHRERVTTAEASLLTAAGYGSYLS